MEQDTITSTSAMATRNLFMLSDHLLGWRHVAVTERRTMMDFAQQL